MLHFLTVQSLRYPALSRSTVGLFVPFGPSDSRGLFLDRSPELPKTYLPAQDATVSKVNDKENRLSVSHRRRSWSEITRNWVGTLLHIIGDNLEY